MQKIKVYEDKTEKIHWANTNSSNRETKCGDNGEIKILLEWFMTLFSNSTHGRLCVMLTLLLLLLSSSMNVSLCLHVCFYVMECIFLLLLKYSQEIPLIAFLYDTILHHLTIFHPLIFLRQFEHLNTDRKGCISVWNAFRRKHALSWTVCDR